MIIQSIGKATIYQPTFLSKSVLKTEFRDGHIPLKKDITGTPIDKDNISVDHTVPKSKGGKSNFYNYSLMDKRINTRRGSEKLEKFIDVPSLVEYIKVMLDVKTEKLDGVDYVKHWLGNLLKEFNR